MESHNNGLKLMPSAWFSEDEESIIETHRHDVGLYAIQICRNTMNNRRYVYFLIDGFVVRRFGLFVDVVLVKQYITALLYLFEVEFPTQPDQVPHPIMKYELEADEQARREAREYEELAYRMSVLAYQAQSMFASRIYEDIGKDMPAFYDFINGDDFDGELV